MVTSGENDPVAPLTADRTPPDINNINQYTDYSLMNLSPKMFWVFCMWAILTMRNGPHILETIVVESVIEIS